MFEMKYDKNGMAIPGQEPVQEQPKQEVEVQSNDQANSVSVEEDLQQDSQEVEQQEVKKQSGDKEENLRRLREKSERLERERDEALRVAQELHVKYTQPQQQAKQQQIEDDENLNINPEDFVEGKHLNKFERKIKKLEEQVKQYQQKTTEIALESQLKTQYPDFDRIVSKENIEALRQTDPDIADAIHHTPDLYKKAVLAYKMIKKLGVVPEDNYQKERELAQKNSLKPKPLNTVNPQQGDSPLSRANAFANGLTDELRSQLLKEMAQARKGN